MLTSASTTNTRNPILVSYAAKGLLPYKGLGSGIKRAMEDWPDISFTDDREGCMFIASVRSKEIDDAELAEKTSQKIIELMQNDPVITIADLALHIGITERAIKMQIEKLKAQGRIQRIGPDKGGHWQTTK
ncbi:MAG: winged helix-turn-helix transcriptional regulator [Methanothrix sp.]|nr:winged helix-turn-helix transcriptional regulator [Methanothrix sp.]